MRKECRYKGQSIKYVVDQTGEADYSVSEAQIIVNDRGTSHFHPLSNSVRRRKFSDQNQAQIYILNTAKKLIDRLLKADS